MGKRNQLTHREKKQLEYAAKKQADIITHSSYQGKQGSNYNLDKFQLTENQLLIEDSIYENVATIVQGSSGVGKTTVAVRTALQLLKGNNHYDKVRFIKNPTESGDDAIGFLTGDKDEKLEKHFEVMRRVFLRFMSAGTLECDEKNGKISFDIPNFIQGDTFENEVVIVDESQNMSPSTLKMVMERCGENTILIVLGDKLQTYAVNSRKDGFTDFISRITDVELGEDGKEIRYSKEPLFGYIELTTDDNKRSDLSKRITELYAA